MYLVKSLPTGTGKIETTFCKDSSVFHQSLTTIAFGWEKLVFWTNWRTPPPSPEVGTKKNIDVFFGILDYSIFMKMYHFW